MEPRPLVFPVNKDEHGSTEMLLNFKTWGISDKHGEMRGPQLTDCEVMITLEAVTYFLEHEQESVMSVNEAQQSPCTVLKKTTFKTEVRRVHLLGWRKSREIVCRLPITNFYNQIWLTTGNSWHYISDLWVGDGGLSTSRPPWWFFPPSFIFLYADHETICLQLANSIGAEVSYTRTQVDKTSSSSPNYSCSNTKMCQCTCRDRFQWFWISAIYCFALKVKTKHLIQYAMSFLSHPHSVRSSFTGQSVAEPKLVSIPLRSSKITVRSLGSSKHCPTRNKGQCIWIHAYPGGLPRAMAQISQLWYDITFRRSR